MTDPLSPTPLSEEERLHFTNLREAWRRAAPVYTDLAATDVEWLCTLIDRLSPGVAEPPAEDPLFDEAVRVTGNLAREAEIAHLREQERDRYREGLEAVAHIAFLEEGRSYKERLHRAGNYAVNAIRPDLAFPPDPPEEN